jgi:sugar lactone lactonase YvrE
MKTIIEKWEVLGTKRCILGEGVVWDARHNTVRYLDITGQKFHSIRWEDCVEETRSMPQIASCVGLRRTGGLLVAMRDGIYSFINEDFALAHLPIPIAGSRFNDGKSGPDGRFYAGTISSQGEGCLYSLDAIGNIKILLEGIRISNGLDWSLDEKTFYYCDTYTQKIEAFDFHAETGSISARRTLIEIPVELGNPDGLTVDAEGFIWVALWNGGGVLRIDPVDRIILAYYPIPATYISCPIFAGASLDWLVVTSAQADVGKAQSLDGRLFRARLPYFGREPYLFG